MVLFTFKPVITTAQVCLTVTCVEEIMKLIVMAEIASCMIEIISERKIGSSTEVLTSLHICDFVLIRSLQG